MNNDIQTTNNIPNSVDFIDETGQCNHAAYVAECLSQLMDDLDLNERELTLVFVNDATIQALNRDHRSVDAPTDVLSYPTHEPEDVSMPTIPHLGDIIISVDTAAAQAQAAGHSLSTELLVLAAHGLTHLLGYDHVTEDEWHIFRNHQKRILDLAL
ncbi:MAG: rRNA maturation RNase YbeY [Deinococcota bacterium]